MRAPVGTVHLAVEAAGREPQAQRGPSVCRHCGAQGYPGAERCHSCGKSYGSSNTLYWVLGLCAALILALIVGLGLVCSSVIGGAGELAGEGLDVAQEELQRVNDKTAITERQFESVKATATERGLKRELGKPGATGADRISRSFPGEPPGSSCLYYNELGAPVINGLAYRFCFLSGKLVRKERL